MADIQKFLIEFDSNIRLKRFDENEMLREKRDVIIRKLTDRFDAMRKEGKDIPTFTCFNQGSYQLGTGIQPAEGDYDIDVGIRFACASSKYSDPVTLKALVADALDGHTSTPIEVRRSCVTVRYKQGGEPAYHVDLAVYTYDDPDGENRKLLIAKGKRNSDDDQRYWEASDPVGLIDWVSARFTDEDDRAQFFRVIRALKRWKTERFSVTGNAAPSGIALTVAAGTWFIPSVQRRLVAKTVTPDDLDAMLAFVNRVIERFVPAANSADGSTLYRLRVELPVEPFKDLFEKMTEIQMTSLRERLIELRDALVGATETADPVVACEKLRAQFGKEFPVPPKEATAQPRGRAVSSAGVSA